jgi:phosphopantothenoylcysteine synthetase/decarboxylase
MRILVTAGNTLVPIDRVRGITNIFSGRTGTRLALHFQERGHQVVLLTSHPDLVDQPRGSNSPAERLQVQAYLMFDELRQDMEKAVRNGGFDVIVHCAAVSDYRAEGIYAPAKGTRFVANTLRWESTGPAMFVDKNAPKVKSNEPELWLRLVRTPKLVDFIRPDWGFQGILVKFKLEVDSTDEQLLESAERSRRQSGADLMVANTLEGVGDWAFIGPLHGGYARIDRAELPERLLAAVETLHRERAHG